MQSRAAVDVDDPTATAGDHVRCDEPGHEVSAEDVDLLDVPPLLGFGGEQVDLSVDDPGVVDEHVDATVPRHDPLDPASEPCPVGNRRHRTRAPLDGVPGVLEGVGNDPADSPGGAGHDGDVVTTTAPELSGRRRHLSLVADPKVHRAIMLVARPARGSNR